MAACPGEYGAGIKLAIDRRRLMMRESRTFVTFTAADAELRTARASGIDS
jgi:hypothetical protein